MNNRILTLQNTIILLRFGIALVFFLHAVVRIYNGTIPRFGEFLSAKGLPIGITLVWVITFYEIIGSILLAIGVLRRWIAAGFILILLVGIVLIHAQLGWFVGEHGTGGVEYSFILIIGLMILMAED